MAFLIIGGGSGIGKTTLGRQLETLLRQKYGPMFGLKPLAIMTTHPTAFANQPNVFCEHIFIRVGAMGFDTYPHGFSGTLQVWRKELFVMWC